MALVSPLPSSGDLGLLEIQNHVFGTPSPWTPTTNITGKSLLECFAETKPVLSGDAITDFYGYKQYGRIYVQSTWNTQIFWIEDHNTTPNTWSVVGNNTFYELSNFLPSEVLNDNNFKVSFTKTDGSTDPFAASDNIAYTLYTRQRDVPANSWSVSVSKTQISSDLTVVMAAGGHADYYFVFEFNT
jgi:hypothetical protein